MKVFITGSNGMIGHALVPLLESMLSFKLFAPRRSELNLLDQQAVVAYVEKIKPDMVIHLAAVVGGIQANINRPVDFLVKNTMMSVNLIDAAQKNKVPNFLNVGSSCMYPKDREELNEDDLLTGKLEPTNEGYAIAKVTSTLLCEYVSRQFGYHYKTIIPSNVYGPYDNFDPIQSHLIPAVIRKMSYAVENKLDEVQIWGDGEARREFMYVSDLADFIMFVIDKLDSLPSRINVGLGCDYSINEYYKAIADLMGYKGCFTHDLNKAVGMKRKRLDVSKAKSLGWSAKVDLSTGLKKTIEFFKKNHLTEKCVRS